MASSIQHLTQNAVELPQLNHRMIATNGVNLHVVEAGPQAGPLVILLHGFPEFWYAWRNQIGPLANAGFRVWAVDQRGYNLSDKPPGLQQYSVYQLTRDVVGLIDAAGRQQVSLVGHDWGGAVAWATALYFPRRLNRLIVLNCPHGKVMAEKLNGNPGQMLKSWYIFFFRLRNVPEWLLARGNYKAFSASLKKAGAGAVSEDDLAEYRQAWAQPGATTGMVNWYRALWKHAPAFPDDVTIHVPTLLLWGARDRYLRREMAQPSIDLCPNGRLEFLEDASHWLHLEHPDRVTRAIDQFLRVQA